MDLTQITQLLRRQIGLDHGTIGEKSIELAVQSRMQALGLQDLASYVERVFGSRPELQALTEEVVVPETWFFRGFEQLRYMAEVGSQWRPALSGQPLRVLSIPCSTGEEPYSIHMFLRHHGLAPEQIQIVAVDISQRAIDRAMQGRYSELSFREKHPLCDLLRHRFCEGHEKNTVVAEVRSAVSFRRDNLVAPMFLADGGAFDLIFCRNILIYFDQPARQQVLNVLDRLLAPGGTIFGGHAEPLAMFDGRLKSVGPPGAFAYQRSEVAAATNAKKPSLSFAQDATPIVRPAQPAFKSAFAPTIAERRTGGVSPLVGAASDTVPPSSGLTPLVRRAVSSDLLATAEQAANSGRLHDARKLCEQHFEQHGPTAPACCLMGMIHQAAGELTDAEKSFHKAVYLDPAHKDSLWHLTLLAEKRGDHRAVETFKRRLARVTGGD